MQTNRLLVLRHRRWNQRLQPIWVFQPATLVAAAITLAATLTVPAATVYWVGGSGDWSTPANWSSGTVPGPSDEVVIDLPGTLAISHVSGDHQVQSIQCQENFVLSGGSLLIAQASQFGGLVTLSGGTLTGGGDVTATTSFSWTGGTMTGAGTTIIPAGATLTMAGGTLGRELRNHGTATWNGNSWLIMAGGTINNHGAFTINPGYSFGNSGANAFNNLAGATLTKVGAGTLQLQPNGGTMSLNNSGTLNVEVGTLNLAGGGVNNATINVASGATLWMEGSYTYAASSALGGPGTFYLHVGTHSFPVGAQVTVGILTLSGATLSFTDPVICSQFNFVGGTLTGSGDVTATNTFNWTSGTMSGSGKTIIPAGATLAMSETTTLGRVLENYGAATWTHPWYGGSWLHMAAGTINNHGAFTINNSQYMLCDGDGGVNAFNNLPGATLTKMGAAQVEFRHNVSAMPLNNSGTVNVQGGTMALATLGDNRGVLNVVQGTMRINAGDANFEGDGVIRSESGGTFELYRGALEPQVGNLIGNTTNASQYTPKGRVLIDGIGARQFEIMSRDLGNVPAGYETNFAYGTVELAGGVNVTLVDLSDNSPGTEALYLDNLIVPAGTTLNLAGLPVYVRVAQILGTLTGGSLNVSPNVAGPLTPNSILPSAISIAGEEDDWTFFGRQGQVWTIAVETGGASVPTPQLGFSEVRLLDPATALLAAGSNSVSGQTVLLQNVPLAVDGTYHLQVRAPGNQPLSAGHYRVAAWEVTPDDAPLVLSTTQHSRIETPYSVDHWTFSAVAGQQVRFDLIATSAPGVAFTLTGPSGWVGFSGLTGDSGLVTLPVDGSYAVTAFGTGGALDLAYSFNLEETLQTPLAVGQTFNGQFSGSGQAQIFLVTISNSGPLRVTLTSIAGIRTELYAARSGPPTRGAFEFSSATGNDANRSLFVPHAPAGTLYLLLYGDNVPNPGAYTIQVTSAALFLTDITPTQEANNVALTMKLTGAGFETGTTVDLLADGGVSAGAATNVSVDSYTQLTATFPPNLAPPGVYSVHIHQPDGDDAVLSNAFTMLTNGQPKLVARIIMPESVRRDAVATMYIEYANEGTASMPAPLLVFNSAPRSDPPHLVHGIPDIEADLRFLDHYLKWQEAIKRGFWSAWKPADVTKHALILASGAQAGWLAPGERSRVSIPYLGLQQPWDFALVDLEMKLGYVQANDPRAMYWFSEAIRPPTLNTAIWDVVFANLTADIVTKGDYVRVLDENAQFLAQLGQPTTDANDLWNFEVLQAYGFSALPVLDSVVDSAVPTPGVPLKLARRFASNLRSRNSIGWFGRGWFCPWESHLMVEGNGDRVTLVGEAGSARVYTRDVRDNSYFPDPGDTSTLTSLGGGLYEVRKPNGIVTRFRADGRIDYVQDPNDNRTSAAYDGSGRLTQLSHTSGGFISLTYNGAGYIAGVANSTGRSVTYSYSGDYLDTATTDDGQVPTYTHETAGTAAQRHALLSVARGATTRHFTYDARGRLASTFLAAGEQLVQFGYDNAGKVSVTDALGTTQLFFDHNGQLAKVVDPLGNITTSEFNSSLRLSRRVFSTGESQSFDWCDCGSPTSITDELGHTTTFSYDNPLKRMTSFTDARLNTTAYTYDSQGNRLSTVYPNNFVERVGNYTATGLAQSSTNRRGQPISFTYLASGQVDRQTFADGSYADFDYDSRGNMTNVTEHPATGPDKVTSYFYEPAVTGDRLRKVTYPNARWVEFAYDAFGRRQRITDSAGGDTRYEYDTAGRLWKLRDAADNVLTEYLYNAAGRLARINKGNGTYTTYSYDAAGQLLHLINYAPGDTVNSRFDYTYDRRGRPITIGTVDGDWVYEYDAIGQLIRARFTSSNVLIPDQDLQSVYDALGNRISTSINGAQVNYSANNLNQYATVNGVPFQYDADGNLTSDGVRTYQYDSLSRLIRTSGPEGTTDYEYDGLGNRIASVVNGQRTEHLLDPTGLVDVLAQHDGNGNLVARFIQGQGLIARTSAGGQNSFYDFDALGSASALTDLAGAPANRYNYLPFGEPLSVLESIPNPFQFVGAFGVAQEGNDLSFMRARFLHRNLGRFTAIDPIRLGGEDINLYRYVGNSPTRFVDPQGTILADAAAALALPYVQNQRDTGTINKNASDQLNQIEKEFDDFNPPNQPAPDPDSDPLDNGKIPVRRSGDPNEKFGASGVGTKNWIQADTVIPYRVNFENVGPGSRDADGNPFSTFADAPAQLVTISDQLSTNLDWSTFELVELGFGDTIVPIPPGRRHYAGSVPLSMSNETFNVEMAAGIESATGRVFARFQAIDPLTSLPPSLAGFLPPEDGTGRGKGHFSFLVRTKTNLTNGAEIRNVALIEFDHLGIIATDQIDPQNPGAGVSTNKQALNTMDAGAPSSSVSALPDESASPFVVQWSGSDDPLGSGVASYDIYASTNGGAFGAWILGTNGSSAPFVGEVGKTYAFYSIARDAVGFAELPPETPDAFTTVIPNVPATPPTLIIAPSGTGLFTLSWPSSYAGFILEYTASLTPPVEWHEVTIGITESGGIKSYTVTNDPGVPGRLYRLRLP